jgi:hypothetical protein
VGDLVAGRSQGAGVGIGNNPADYKKQNDRKEAEGSDRIHAPLFAAGREDSARHTNKSPVFNKLASEHSAGTPLYYAFAYRKQKSGNTNNARETKSDDDGMKLFCFRKAQVKPYAVFLR